MNDSLGVYIHIPFCASRCAYCDFCSLAGADSLKPRYHEALLQHITESEDRFVPYIVDSVYFGGGTPSHYGAIRIDELFSELKYRASVLKSAEVTLEANPDSVTPRELGILRRAGINRISLGMQSANDDILQLLGRRHSHRQTVDAAQNIRNAGFENLSIDLIYGLPSQTRREWADTLSRALELRPEHISCYGLKLEEGTLLHRQYADSPFIPDDDEQADMYLYTVETLQSYGYPQYEISNFALPGYESRHNLKYWQQGDYMSFGASAHSLVSNVRYSYTSNVRGYISGVLEGQSVIDSHDIISRYESAAEYLMLGLRTVEGISGEKYSAIAGGDFSALERLFEGLAERGLAQKRENGNWRLTPRGFLVSNTVIGMLLSSRRGDSTGGSSDADNANATDAGLQDNPQGKIYLRDFS